MTWAQAPVRIDLELFAEDLLEPVDIAHCGDERLFIVERAGRIMILDAEGNASTTPFLDIQERVNSNGGEQGLLGLTFDPDYATNGEFYVHYIAGTGNGSTRVSRFRVTGDPAVADPESEEIIYTMVQPAPNHNGGDIDFGPDGYLYFMLGDGGSANDPLNNGQTLTNYAAGDIVRINVHETGEEPYTIPPTNPWANLNNDTLPEIWGSGLRNPWRFGFDALTGDLWIGDVGQGQREEVDFWPAGDNSGPNFGWRCYEGDIPTPGIDDDCPAAEEFVQPVSVHTHSNGWISVIGGRVYRGDQFPRLYGRYIYTDYGSTPYFSLVPDGEGGFTRERIRSGNGGAGTTCIAENSALEIFVARDNGNIYRIVDACMGQLAPTIAQEGNELTSSEADAYAWYLNGELIEGANTQTYTATANGEYFVVATFNTNCFLQSETVTLIIDAISGTGAGGSLAVSPVPADGSLTVSELTEQTARLEIVDLNGRVVVSKPVKGSGRVELDTMTLPDGSYVLRAVSGTGAVIHQNSIQVLHR